MKVNITSRDLKFFTLGVFAMLVFVIIYDWEEFQKGLMGEAPKDTALIELFE